MRLPFFIAFRYLFSKKKINAIHIINRIAMLGFGVGAFAMIVILSAFNGFEELVGQMISNYDADIVVKAEGKKVFEPDEEMLFKIESLDAVHSVSQTLEENVVIKYQQRQEIARLKGVDENFNSEKFDTLMVVGDFYLKDDGKFFGVFGGGLSSKLGIFPASQELVSVFVPRRNVTFNSLNPEEALSIDYLSASGIFVVHEEIDNEVFITDLAFARNLLDHLKAISSLDIQLKEGRDRAEVKTQLAELLGTTWKVTTREEQNELIFKIFKSEKWFTYAILSLVLFISAFNIFGSLIMLVLDKRKDISVLKSMGATGGLIRKVFLLQGSYIAILGGLIGLVLGLLTVASQMRFKWLTMDNSIVEFYPVQLRSGDVVLTLLTVILLGYIMSIYPANRAKRLKTQALN